MKKMFLALITVVLATGSGCGKANSKAPITNNGSRVQRNNGGTSGPIDQSLLQGQVFQFTDKSASDFMAAIKGYLSASVPSEFVGNVEGDFSQPSNNNTGFFIGGRVKTSGAFNPNGTSRMSIQSSGEVLVAIYDQYVGQKDEKGEVIPPFSIRYNSIAGEVNGRTVDLIAKDEYNEIRMVGDLVGSNFEGRIYYRNFQTVDNSTPSPSHQGIGWFRISACAMFVCN